MLRLSVGAAAAVVVAIPVAAQVGVSNTGNPWTIGMDASFSHNHATFKGEPFQTSNSYDIPIRSARIGYWYRPSWQFEVPASFTYGSSEGVDEKLLTVGFLANYFFTPHDNVRPFIGAGPAVSYATFSNESSQAQFSVRAQGGIEWSVWPSVSFRPALFYSHGFERHDAAKTDNYGLTFGPTIHFGDDRPNDALAPVQLSVGFELTRASGSSTAAITARTSTSLTIPSEYFGVYVPLGDKQQWMVGGTFHADYIKFSDTDVEDSMLSSQELAPGFQYNFNPNYHSEGSWRVGGHVGYSRAHDTFGTTTSTQSWWSYGGDVSYTIPFGRSLNYFGGVGYDYQPASSSASLPKYSTWSLKFGIDAR